MMPHQDLRAVVDLERVGYAHHSAGARLHPEWLIVGRPVHQEIESNLLQEVGRSVRRGHPWRHPASGRCTERAFDGVPNLLQEALLVRFPHVAVPLWLCPTIPNNLTPPPFHPTNTPSLLLDTRPFVT